MPAAFYPSVVVAGGEWILEGKRTARNKAKTRHPAPPDFPTCDVQGVEVKVFRRAQRLLKEKHPGIICGLDSEEKQRDGLERLLPFAYTWQPCGTNHLLALPQ